MPARRRRPGSGSPRPAPGEGADAEPFPIDHGVDASIHARAGNPVASASGRDRFPDAEGRRQAAIFPCRKNALKCRDDFRADGRNPRVVHPFDDSGTTGLRQMPRFRVRTCKGDGPDEPGDPIEFPDAKAARDDAQKALVGMARDSMPLDREIRFGVEVEDEAGRRTYKASLVYSEHGTPEETAASTSLPHPNPDRDHIDESGNPMARPIALVVEDEPILMMQAVSVIEDAGFEVLEARNADEAISMLESRDDIRVVVTDVRMPGSMDGIKLARAVRDRWPPVLIIVVSGHVKPHPRDLPDDIAFLSKPYSDSQMHDALARMG